MADLRPILIAPSILSADFARLGEQVTEAEAAGADRIQIDVMDGVFVPNISVGLPVLEAVRNSTGLFLEAHLMIVQPERYIDEFVKAGADMIILHQEACVHLHRAVERIKSLGKQVGVALNPATPNAMLDEILGYIDLALVMTVNPGFGGQRFIESMLPKITQLRRSLQERDLDHIEIEVDGGVDAVTAPKVVRAGATVLVAGSSVYSAKAPVAENMRVLREAIELGRTYV